MAISEFRQNLASGEWVLFATGRAQRPHQAEPRQQFTQSVQECPFEDLKRSGQEIVWREPDSDDWRVTVIKNKFPAVAEGQCGPDRQFGPFNIHSAIGVHDVFVFREHEGCLHDFSPEQMIGTVRAYKRRTQELARLDGCIRYVMLFHNFGREAGASIAHPHSQVLAMPILPPSVSRSLHGAYRFFQENRKKVYEVMMIWEKEQAKRIVYENDFFVAFCPFASRRPGEIRIFPRDGMAHFGEMPDELDRYFAQALSIVLRTMKRALNDPAFNFFIHTAPTEGALGDIHEYYSWHVEIIPKLKIDAGFELGTGVDINPVDPDEVAQLLRDAEVL